MDCCYTDLLLYSANTISCIFLTSKALSFISYFHCNLTRKIWSRFEQTTASMLSKTFREDGSIFMCGMFIGSEERLYHLCQIRCNFIFAKALFEALPFGKICLFDNAFNQMPELFTTSLIYLFESLMLQRCWQR